MRAGSAAALAVAAAGAPDVGLRAQENVEVRSGGFFLNRDLERRLAFFHDMEQDAELELDAVALEDTAFLLMQELEGRGYLRPTVRARLFRGGETVRTVEWSGDYGIRLTSETSAERVVFEVDRGVLFYYASVEVSGATAIGAERLKRFFIPGGALFVSKKDRAFTPGNFKRRVGRVARALRARGYRSAEAVSRETEIDAETGAVRAFVRIDQGPLNRVRRYGVTRITESGTTQEGPWKDAERARLTPDWERERRLRILEEAYAQGFAEASVTMETVAEHERDTGALAVDVRFRVELGPRLRVGEIAFRGAPEVSRKILRRQARLNSGEPLNPQKIDEGRRRLLGLGVFRTVDAKVVEGEGDERSVVYELEPGTRQSLDVRVGWGSYELGRLGFEWTHVNPWGRAHRYDVEAKQSFRASRLDATYSVPRVFGTNATAFGKANFLRREEISYDRTVFGASLGFSTRLSGPDASLSSEYALERQESDRDDDAAFETVDDATVASLGARAAIDRRDDVLYPTEGYNAQVASKTASEFLGGQVGFQKFEFGGGWHASLGGGFVVHAGWRYGTIFSWRDADENIPFNERFFPGGENSVRGYQRGEAAPLDAAGDEVGAESFALGHLEAEQRLTRKLSAVLFADAVGMARDDSLAPTETFLYSVGAGLRYRTVVGPIRLEYGHNPDPRPEDPDGTLHFSIGFPF